MQKFNKIVFIHIPKTAGSSLRNAIESSYTSKLIAPYENIFNLEKAVHLDYKLFRGHFGYQDAQIIPGAKEFITVLRDPVERVISLYNYWNKVSKYYNGSPETDLNYDGVMLAKKATLTDFINTKK